MHKYIFSLLLIVTTVIVQAQDKKNQIGFEVLKPVYSIMHSQMYNKVSDFKGYNVEAAYTRVLMPFVSYRATVGAVKYGLENDTKNFQYRSEGWFLKQGLDFLPNGEENKFNFIIGLSAIVSNYEETQRGFFEGKYYPTVYTPYTKNKAWAIGGELALRLRWLLGDFMAIEFSNKLAFRSNDDSNKLERMYVPGFGPRLAKESPLSAITFPGLEFKVYFRF